MSVLALVRHGKASALSDYDNLSPPGIEQSRLLGAFWAERCFVPERVFVGPRRRHAQTHEQVAAEVAAAGLAWPTPEPVAELDEHDGINLVFRLLPELARTDEALQGVAGAMARGETPSHTDVLMAFKRITRQWARGEVGHPEVESWTAFRARVQSGLAKMTHPIVHGRTVVAFTSAGTVAAAVGHVLSLGDEAVLDLSWSLHNGAVSELAYSDSGWGLRTFNGTAHIRDTALITSV
jgi:broad specificity phosphatase PhoE